MIPMPHLHRDEDVARFLQIKTWIDGKAPGKKYVQKIAAAVDKLKRRRTEIRECVEDRP
jgi:hypothetical protein